MKKTIITILCAALLLCCMTACGKTGDSSTPDGSELSSLAASSVISSTANSSQDASSGPAAPVAATTEVISGETYSTYNLLDNEDFFKLDGRYSKTGTGITCDWSASGIEFTADCKGTVSVTVNANAATYFIAYIDGVRQSDRLLANGVTKLTVAQKLSEGTHTVRLLKQTEALRSTAEVRSVTLCGKPSQAPQAASRYIEFYGDSITAGYGAYPGTGTNGAYQDLDGTQSYAFLAAEQLKADCSMICVSGIGICVGYTPYTMPQIFDKVSYLRNTASPYSFDRKPTAIVINMGTNDNTKGAAVTDFVTAYKALVNSLRTKYSADTPVVLCYGTMLDTGNAINRASLTVASELGGESSGVYTCQMKYDRSGVSGHPTAAAQAENGKTLADFLEKII